MIRNRFVLFALCLWWSAAALFGQAAPDWLADSLPVDASIRSGRLANGLQYYLFANDEPRDRAEFRLVVRAGSLQEADDQLGVAHFVEHMAFNGTARFPKQSLVDFLERSGSRFGADINAYTSFDRTVYQLDMRTDSLPLLDRSVRVLADWARAVSFEPEEIDKERGVVISEWRSRLGASERIQRQTYPVLYAGSRYAERLPIGSPELIDTVSATRVRDYYTRWYRPENMAVIIGGDLDLDWAEARIREYFADWQPPGSYPPPEKYRLVGTPRDQGILATDPEYSRTQVRLTYQAAEHREAEPTYAELRRDLLYQFYNRLLNFRLRELIDRPNPPFSFGGAYYSSTLGETPVFSLSATTEPGRIDSALLAVYREVVRAERFGFTATELERAKLSLLSGLETQVKRYEDRRSDQIAGQLVGSFLEGDPPQDFLAYAQRIPALLATITLEELNEIAGRYRSYPRRTLVLTAPEADRSALPDLDALPARIDSLLTAPLDPYVDEVVGTELLAQRPPEREARLVAQDTVLDIQTYELDNGVRLVLKATDFEADRIRISGFAPGGNSTYGPDYLPTLSNFGGILSQMGVDTFTDAQLSRLLTGKQLSLQFGLGEEYRQIGGSTTAEDLEAFFQLLWLRLQRPRFDTTVIAAYRERQRAATAQLAQDPRYGYREFRNRLLYNDHPRYRLDNLLATDKLTLDRFERIYREQFAGIDSFTFLFVGELPDNLVPLAARYLGNLPTTGAPAPVDLGVPFAQHPIDTMYYAGQTPRAEVDVLFRAPFPDYYNRNRRYAVNALESLLTYRLRNSMREEAGGVYGVSVGGGIGTTLTDTTVQFTFRFNVDPERLEELQGVFDQEIERSQTDSATAEELQKIAEQQLASYRKNRRNNGYWLGQLSARLRGKFGWQGLYPGSFETVVADLTADRLQALAREIFAGGTRVRFVLLPEEQ
jgi:zinc protease